VASEYIMCVHSMWLIGSCSQPGPDQDQIGPNAVI